MHPLPPNQQRPGGAPGGGNESREAGAETGGGPAVAAARTTRLLIGAGPSNRRLPSTRRRGEGGCVFPEDVAAAAAASQPRAPGPAAAATMISLSDTQSKRRPLATGSPPGEGRGGRGGEEEEEGRVASRRPPRGWGRRTPGRGPRWRPSGAGRAGPGPSPFVRAPAARRSQPWQRSGPRAPARAAVGERPCGELSSVLGPRPPRSPGGARRGAERRGEAALGAGEGVAEAASGLRGHRLETSGGPGTGGAQAELTWPRPSASPLRGGGQNGAGLGVGSSGGAVSRRVKRRASWGAGLRRSARQGRSPRPGEGASAAAASVCLGLGDVPCGQGCCDAAVARTKESRTVNKSNH